MKQILRLCRSDGGNLTLLSLSGDGTLTIHPSTTEELEEETIEHYESVLNKKKGAYRKPNSSEDDYLSVETRAYIPSSSSSSSSSEDDDLSVENRAYVARSSSDSQDSSSDDAYYGTRRKLLTKLVKPLLF